MQSIRPTERHSTPAPQGATTMYIEIECHLRAAGRGLEWVGVSDPEAARLSRVLFRLASRVRSDRLAASV